MTTPVPFTTEQTFGYPPRELCWTTLDRNGHPSILNASLEEAAESARSCNRHYTDGAPYRVARLLPDEIAEQVAVEWTVVGRHNACSGLHTDREAADKARHRLDSDFPAVAPHVVRGVLPVFTVPKERAPEPKAFP